MTTPASTVLGPETTLGMVVTRFPSLARELERLDLDYCCGGDRTLGQACRERGLDPAAVVAELRSAAGDEPPARWSTLDVDELVDHLVDVHHRYLDGELPRLGALLDKVVGVHRARHGELDEIAACFAAIRSDLEPHLQHEERVLFPAIKQLAAAPAPPGFGAVTIGQPISAMLREHDELGELLRTLRSLCDDYTVPPDGCASYEALYAGLEQFEADTHLHIHKENNVLFPRVVLLEERRRC